MGRHFFFDSFSVRTLLCNLHTYPLLAMLMHCVCALRHTPAKTLQPHISSLGVFLHAKSTHSTKQSEQATNPVLDCASLHACASAQVKHALDQATCLPADHTAPHYRLPKLHHMRLEPIPPE